VIGLAVASRIAEAPIVLLAGAIVCYVGAAWEALDVVRVRKFRVSDAAGDLWRRYWQDDPYKVKHAIVADIVAPPHITDWFGTTRRAPLRAHRVLAARCPRRRGVGSFSMVERGARSANERGSS
jgi:hypothetical protein